MHNVAEIETNIDIPLVVDLDGTLIKTDLLYESIIQGIKNKPFIIFLIISWLLHGKTYLKRKLAESSIIDVKLLPYNNKFINYLKEEHQKGRTLILATASYKMYAYRIAEHLGIFSKVFATDDNCNLKGSKKLQLLLSIYGEKGFDYAGDSAADLPIFPEAREAILVEPDKKVFDKATKTSHIKYTFHRSNNYLFSFLKAIRIHQWLKNILIFIPLFTSHNFFNIPLSIKTLIGFLAFSFCASGMYIINDLFDLPADRNHPRKRNRPFASGDISIVSGFYFSVVLLITGLSLSYLLKIQFGAITVLYLLLTTAYSFHLKKYALIDTIGLAGLYTIRVIAGAFLIDVHLSFWLLTFSIFIFYCLALLKRVTELQSFNNLGQTDVKGRGYIIQDIESLRSMGIASGLLSIVVFALYINSNDVLPLYSRPQILWLICPLLLYWVNRLWLKTGREEMNDDPVVFTIKDRGCQIVFLTVCILLFIASYF